FLSISKPNKMNFSNESEQLIKQLISENLIGFYDYSGFTDLAKINEGGFGKIEKAKWKSFGLTVALKSLKVNANSDEFIKEPLNRLIEKAIFDQQITFFNKTEFSDTVKSVKDFKASWKNYGIKVALIYLNDKNLKKNVIQEFINKHYGNIMAYEGKMIITGFCLSEQSNTASCSISKNTVQQCIVATIPSSGKLATFYLLEYVSFNIVMKLLSLVDPSCQMSRQKTIEKIQAHENRITSLEKIQALEDRISSLEKIQILEDKISFLETKLSSLETKLSLETEFSSFHQFNSQLNYLAFPEL
ncbi:8239_t:CDS:2, partial [Cetraspora pellucida]